MWENVFLKNEKFIVGKTKCREYEETRRISSQTRSYEKK